MRGSGASNGTPRWAAGLLAAFALGAAGLLWWVAQDSTSPESSVEVESVARELGPAPVDGALVAPKTMGTTEESLVSPIAGATSRRELGFEAARSSPAESLDHYAAVRVVDRGSSKPVEGAAIASAWLAGEELSAGWEAERSSADGLLLIRSTMALEIDVEISADGYVAGIRSGLEWSTSPDVARTAAVDVTLEPSAAIELDLSAFPRDSVGLALLFERSDARDGRPDAIQDWDGSRLVRFHDVAPGLVAIVLCPEGAPPVTRQAIEVRSGDTVRLELGPRQGEVVRGRVVERTTRQPLEGVRVAAAPSISGLSIEVERLSFEPVVTDADGRFEFDGLPPGEVVLRLSSDFGPEVERTILVVEGDATRSRELALRGAASLSGRVVVEGRADLADVDVAVIATGEVSKLELGDATADSALALASAGSSVEVEPDGTFRTDRAPVARSVTLVAIAGRAFGVCVVDPPLRMGEDRRGIELSLSEVEPAAFRVVDASGASIEALRASFRWTVGRAATWSPWIDLAAEGGEFTLPVDGGSVRRVRLRAEGFWPYDGSWPDTPEAQDEAPTFVLEPAWAVDVVVRDQYGLAVSDARALATPAELARAGGRATRGARRSARTDRFGRARVELDREGEWTVDVTCAGYTRALARSTRVGAATGPERLVFSLEREAPPEPATVRGRLVRRGDGAPPPAYRFDGLRGGSAETNGAEFVLVGLRSGRASIVARAEGYESVRLPVETLEPGETLDVGEVVTRGATRLDVRVRDARGRPVRDANVRLLRLPTSASKRSDLPRRINFPGRGDSRGVFRRKDVPRARWKLIVERAGSGRVVRELGVKGARKTVDVQLRPR